MKVLIVEDDLSFALEVEMLLNQLSYQVVGIAGSSEDAILKINKEQPDVILIDIYIKGEINGVELAASISKDDIHIVYMTAAKTIDLYEQAKTTNPIAFLIKPFDLLSLRSILERIAYDLIKDDKELPQNGSKSIFLKNSKNIDKVYINDIFYINSVGNYCYIFTKNRKYVLKNSLKKLSDRFNAEVFLKVHRAYLVNKTHIDEVAKNFSSFKINGENIPVGGKFKDAVKAFVNNKTSF